MPGGRLRSQLLITSRCLGWCGERGSERGSLPLNNLELNWMSHFLNQRTTAGFNSFSARKPCRLSFQPARAVLPLPPRVRVPDTALGVRSSPQHLQPPHSKGETPQPFISCSHRPKTAQGGRGGLRPHYGSGIPTPGGEEMLGSPRPGGKRGAGIPPAGAQGPSLLALLFLNIVFLPFSQRNSICRNTRQC